MKLDIFNIDKFIKENRCLPVTNPVALYNDGNPTEDGLFSEIIFGQTLEEQMNKFGYIDLKGNHFIHPAIYAIISSRMKFYRDLIVGEAYAKLVPEDNSPKGLYKVVKTDENDPDGQNGLDFLYDNFDRIDWINDNDVVTSIDKKTRLELFKSLDKDEFFVTKWLVLPRGFRDYNKNDNSLGDEINKVYQKLINLSNSLKSLYGFNLSNTSTKFAIQRQLLMLYYITLKPITGKNVADINSNAEKIEQTGNGKFSLFRKNLIGVNVDFGQSSVITAPNISVCETYDKSPTPFTYARIPLQSLVAMMMPFFIHEVGDFLENIITELDFGDVNYRYDSSTYNPSNVQLLLKRFIKSAADKDTPIEVSVLNKQTGKKEIVNISLKEKDVTSNTIIDRELTILDVIYICAREVIQGKHALITRYPIALNQNISPFRIKAGGTLKMHETEIYIGHIFAKSYDEYPYINYEGSKNPKIWGDLIRVLLVGNICLESFNGDYDGDVLHMRCLFSNQANAEAEKMIMSKANFFNANGDLTRHVTSVKKEVTLGLYELTKKE